MFSRGQCLRSRAAGVRLSRRRAEVDSADGKRCRMRAALPAPKPGDARARKLCSVSLTRTVRGYFNSGSAPPLSLSAPGCARRLTPAPPAVRNLQAQLIGSCQLDRGCAKGTRIRHTFSKLVCGEKLQKHIPLM